MHFSNVKGSSLNLHGHQHPSLEEESSARVGLHKWSYKYCKLYIGLQILQHRLHLLCTCYFYYLTWAWHRKGGYLNRHDFLQVGTLFYFAHQVYMHQLSFFSLLLRTECGRFILYIKTFFCDWICCYDKFPWRLYSDDTNNDKDTLHEHCIWCTWSALQQYRSGCSSEKTSVIGNCKWRLDIISRLCLSTVWSALNSVSYG